MASAPCFPRNGVGSGWTTGKVLSGIIPVLQKGLRWVGAPAADGPQKSLYNRFRHW